MKLAARALTTSSKLSNRMDVESLGVESLVVARALQPLLSGEPNVFSSAFLLAAPLGT